MKFDKDYERQAQITLVIISECAYRVLVMLIDSVIPVILNGAGYSTFLIGVASLYTYLLSESRFLKIGDFFPNLRLAVNS
jgi:hypothetical protein